MIVFKVLKKLDNKIEAINCKGHAEYAEKGSDIVCASVSTILIAILKGLDRYTETEVYGKIDEAEIDVEFKNIDEKSDLLLIILFDTIKELEIKYSNYIKIFEKVVN